MSTILNREVTLVSTDCCNCGVLFAMPDTLLAKHRENGTSFYCPNGHGQHFTQTEKMRLQEQLRSALAMATHERDQRDAAERSNAALRGVITKQKKRASAGVCPCCTRTFQDLARHMSGQHPNYAA